LGKYEMFSAACTKKFEDTKRVVEEEQTIQRPKEKRTKGQIMIYNHYTEN